MFAQQGVANACPRASLLLLLLAMFVATPGADASSTETEKQQSTEQISAADFESHASEHPDSARAKSHEPATDTMGDASDPCDWELEGRPPQEQSQDVVRGVSCHTFRWFDSLFGTEYDYPEDQVNGLLLLGFEWREFDGWDPRLRFRVRAPLPNLTSRWDLIIGRENEEEFVTDTAPRDTTLYNPGLSRDDDNEWLLGLGHRKKNRRKGFEYSVGARLGAPPNLYGKVQYFYNKQFTERTDLRFRQTLFWRTDEGLGTTSRADFVHQSGPRDVLRWEAIGTVSEDTDGLKWYAAQTWYHQFVGKNAISLQGFARGETDRDVSLRDYGLNLLWRQPVTRDWLFLSMGPNITFPRDFPEQKRELSWGFSAWLEMEFGDYRY